MTHLLAPLLVVVANGGQGQAAGEGKPIEALVIATESESRGTLPDDLRITTAGGRLDRQKVANWASRNGFALLDREGRTYLIDLMLTRADDVAPLLGGLRAAAAAYRTDDWTVSTEDSGIKALIERVWAAYGINGDPAGARFVIRPAPRVWLTDGTDWVEVDIGPVLNPRTEERLKASLFEQKSARTPGQPAPRPLEPPQPSAEVLPLDRLLLQATGRGFRSARQRVADLNVVVDWVSEEFRKTLAAYEEARLELDRAVEGQFGTSLPLPPRVGDGVADFSKRWQDEASAAIREHFKNRPEAAREAFTTQARVHQASRNISVTWRGRVGYETRELGAP